MSWETDDAERAWAHGKGVEVMTDNPAREMLCFHGRKFSCPECAEDHRLSIADDRSETWLLVEQLLANFSESELEKEATIGLDRHARALLDIKRLLR